MARSPPPSGVTPQEGDTSPGASVVTLRGGPPDSLDDALAELDAR